MFKHREQRGWLRSKVCFTAEARKTQRKRRGFSPRLLNVLCVSAVKKALCLLALICSFCFPIKAQVDAETWLARHQVEATKYEDTFKNLMAEETKLMEVFDLNGQLRQKRTVIADLLVYQSARDDNLIAEYRNVRNVDGAPIPNYEERATDLFEVLTKMKSLRNEMAKLNDDWLKYDIGRRFWGYTVTQGRLFKALRAAVRGLIAGRETINDRDTVIVVFEQLAQSRAVWGADPEEVLNDIPGLRNRVNVRTRYRGKLWLDKETGQLWKQEVELVADYVNFAQPQVMIRWEQEYQPSDLGILTPKKFVFSWFSNMRNRETSAAQLGLTSRTTYSYGKFRRFDVSSEESKKELINKKP